MLGIRWQDHVRNVNVVNQTGFPPVMNHILFRSHRQDAVYGVLSQSIKLYAKLTCLSAVSWLDQIRDRNDSQRPPPTQPMCVEMLSSAVIVERSNDHAPTTTT